MTRYYPSEADENLIRPEVAAEILGVHPATLRSWVDSGRAPIKVVVYPGHRRYYRSDVIAYRDALTRRSQP